MLCWQAQIEQLEAILQQRNLELQAARRQQAELTTSLQDLQASADVQAAVTHTLVTPTSTPWLWLSICFAAAA